MKRYPIIFLIIPIFAVRVYTAEAIAVSNLSASGITPDEAVSLTNSLRTEIGKTGMYDVMERSQMEEILKEQGFQMTGVCDETKCAIEMGKILAVKYMVLGSIGKVGKTFSLNIRIVDIQTGKITTEVTRNHKGSSDQLLTDIVPQATQELVGTYKAPKKKTGAIITAGSAVVVGAIAVPVFIYMRKDKEEPPTPQSTTDIDVTW